MLSGDRQVAIRDLLENFIGPLPVGLQERGAAKQFAGANEPVARGAQREPDPAWEQLGSL